MPEQLTFDLPAHPALGRGDFLVSPGNEAAVEAIQGWHDWPQGKLVLVGPPGSGKTHLAHVFAAMTGARIIAARDLADTSIDAAATTAVAVEDADTAAGNPAAEQALFHLHNFALAQNQPLLITAKSAPARWQLQLPDLASRMQGSAMVTLSPPDDALLASVLVKLFADRQISIDNTVINYLVTRMERSFASTGRLVEALDRAALSEKRGITRPLAAVVLDKLSENEA